MTRVAATLCAGGEGDAPVQDGKGRLTWGGAKGTRTPNPLLAKQVRYQLRHGPWVPTPRAGQERQLAEAGFGGAERTSSVASAHSSCSARWSRTFFWTTMAPAATMATTSNFLNTGVSSGRHVVVGLRGLEPLTSSLSGKRSNRLSYRPQPRRDRLSHAGEPHQNAGSSTDQSSVSVSWIPPTSAEQML